MTCMVDRRHSASEYHGCESDHIKQADCFQTGFGAECKVGQNDDAQLTVRVFGAGVSQQPHYCSCKIIELTRRAVKLISS